MKLRIQECSEHALLLENYVFNYRGVAYVVPSGFEFNGANIPALFWSILFLHPLHPKVIRGALFHDFLYSKGYKEIADKGFKRIMREDGCNALQVFLIYAAVSLFGGGYVAKQKRAK